MSADYMIQRTIGKARYSTIVCCTSSEILGVELCPVLVYTMKCIFAKDFGKPDDVLEEGDRPIPIIKPRSDQLLIRVHACSLTPGDYRLLLGDARLLKKPTEGFPYIPGLDVSGEVIAVDTPSPKCADFNIGDEVVATWGGIQGEGGMAEYALVDAATTVHRPRNVTPVAGAALANSSGHALLVLRAAEVKTGDRVLVLGGSGGVGHAVVQLVRNAGAAYVAATSTDAAMLSALGVDRVVDYRSEEWTAVPEFMENKFDVVIDCAIGAEAWHNPDLRNVVKSRGDGGRFVAVVLNQWHIEIKSYLGLPFFLLRPLWRQISCRIWGPMPKYTMYIGRIDAPLLKEVLQLAEQGRLKAVLHENNTFPFTEKGAKDAFNLMISRRAHGKVVMQIP